MMKIMSEDEDDELIQTESDDGDCRKMVFFTLRYLFLLHCIVTVTMITLYSPI